MPQQQQHVCARELLVDQREIVMVESIVYAVVPGIAREDRQEGGEGAGRG